MNENEGMRGVGAWGTGGLAAPGIEVRALREHEDYRACVGLQRETWGVEFSECVPATILKVSQRVGGVTAGAFDGAGRLQGFVFGLTGLYGGEAAHWSHMLAVRAEARDLGIGRRLKAYQRAAMLELGVGRVYWTFDPLVARNAHLNLNRLGARVSEYVPHLYAGSDSDLHRGLGTDRLVVSWRLTDAAVELALAGAWSPDLDAYEAAPILNAADGVGGGAAAGGDSARRVRIEIPEDIYEVRRRSLEEAAVWRRATRDAFERQLAGGYSVEGFYRAPDGRCFYVLLRGDGPAGDS